MTPTGVFKDFVKYFNIDTDEGWNATFANPSWVEPVNIVNNQGNPVVFNSSSSSRAGGRLTSSDKYQAVAYYVSTQSLERLYDYYIKPLKERELKELKVNQVSNKASTTTQPPEKELTPDEMFDDFVKYFGIDRRKNWNNTFASLAWCSPVTGEPWMDWESGDTVEIRREDLAMYPNEVRDLYDHYVKPLKDKEMKDIQDSEKVPTTNTFFSSVKGYLCAFVGWLKSMTSGTFESIGKGIDAAKRFLTDNVVFSTAKKMFRFVKSFMNNPKAWLLKLLGIGVFHKELLDMGLTAISYLMKLAKEWLPEPIYVAIEKVYGKVVEIGMRIWKALTDNRPARYFKRLVGAMFGWIEKAKGYVKALIRRKMTEALV